MKKLALLSVLFGAVAFAQTTVQVTGCTSATGGSFTCAFSSAPTAGNDIVVAFSSSIGALAVEPPLVTDTNGVNTYAAAASCASSAARRACVFVAHNIVALNADKLIKVDYQNVSNFFSIAIYEVSGLAALPADTSSSSTNPTACGTLTTSTATAMFEVFGNGVGTGADTGTGGFTVDYNNDANQRMAAAHQYAAAGTYSPGFSASISGTPCLAVAIKKAITSSVRQRLIQ